ncbi:nucleoside hydrolase [Dyadobacter sp. LJ53]|uniref:nucleoside hydrolase n=1 Tax=Dyadobacter chenwenxiniae TaxID=2906456 RepID=UPI001F1D6A76|nr:nucleoside hydrolase [Dyadobacter chenwenxiniae]MCF0049037.1 nucleoside hydrolase [Dyadobacter chenwenxiniae]
MSKPVTLPFARILIVCIFFNVTVPVWAQQNHLFKNNLVQPRMRVIIDNDFSGDPDGLFQLAHQLLSPSVEVRGIIGSHLKPGDGFDNSKTQADNAASKARELLEIMKMMGKVPVIAGSNVGMVNDSTPVKSKAVEFIINEALRTDTKLPLYIVCGAGLTEIASALLTQPAIASKLILIWIGGPEHPGMAVPPPNFTPLEYNLGIDIYAAKVVFNRSSITLWQIPRNAYRQALLPYSELLSKVRPKGQLGEYLTEALEGLMGRIVKYVNIGETYILGDSPLVLLTALQSSFEADPSSSRYALVHAPMITDQGLYQYNPMGRNIRVYDSLDIQMMFNDFFAKIELFNR